VNGRTETTICIIIGWKGRRITRSGRGLGKFPGMNMNMGKSEGDLCRERQQRKQ
jgi:hypothetical protein